MALRITECVRILSVREEGIGAIVIQYQALKPLDGPDVMNPRATAVLTVTKPAAAKTYRLWLVK